MKFKHLQLCVTEMTKLSDTWGSALVSDGYNTKATEAGWPNSDDALCMSAADS